MRDSNHYLLTNSPLALAIALATVSSVALAGNITLEEIVVTAQKREQSLQDVPISVSALSGEKIAEAGIQNFEDVSTYIPNFTIVQDSIGDRINIRGIQSGNQAGFEQSVGTFVDGVYRGRGVQSRFAFLDVGMVEVLRGPQGTLFGKNTVAGALNIRSAKPTDEFEAALTANYNIDFDETELTGHISGALSDNVRGRLAVMTREMKEGWIDNEFYGDDDPRTEEWATRGSLEWDLSPDTLVSFKVEHGDWDNAGRPWELIENGPLAAFGVEEGIDNRGNQGDLESVQDFGASGKFEGESDEYALTVEHNLEGHTLTAILGYSEYEFDRKLDVDYNPLSMARFDDSEDFEQTSLEFRIASETGGAFEYIAGAYYQDADLVADGLSYIGVPDTYALLNGGCLAGGGVKSVGNPLNPTDDALATVLANAGAGTAGGVANVCGQAAAIDAIGGPGAFPGAARYAVMDQSAETWAVFSQVTWNIQDDLRATLGLRYTEEEKMASQSASAPAYLEGNKTIDADPLTTAAAMTFLEFTPHAYTEDDLQRDEESLTWSVNLQWDVNEDIMTYATASTGFKAGGFNSFYMGDKPVTVGAPGTHNADDAEFEEEEVLTFEIGSKMSLLDGAAELNVSLFYTEYDDLQVSVFSGNTTFEVKNAAEATTQGIEIDGRWQASENLLLSGSLGWVDFEFDSFVNQACTNDQFVAWRETQWAGGSNPLAAGLTNAHCAAAGINDLSGETAANTPELSATLSANYTQSMGDFTLDYGVDVLYMDEVHRQDDLDPIVQADAVTKLNASVRLIPASDAWEVALRVNNLTDENEDILWGNDMPLVSGAHEVVVGQPRSVTVAGTLRF